MKSHCQRVALDTLFAFVAILGLVAMFSALGVLNDGLSLAWMIGPFGASITLLLACPESKLGLPYPALVSSTTCAVIGVACQSMLGGHPALAAVVTLTLWAFTDNRISVRFEYEWRDAAGQWYRIHGNEHWEFDETGRMKRRDLNANDVKISESDRRYLTLI